MLFDLELIDRRKWENIVPPVRGERDRGEEIGGGGGKKEERNKSAFSAGEVTNVPSALAMEGEPYLRTPLNQLVRDHILVGSISWVTCVAQSRLALRIMRRSCERAALSIPLALRKGIPPRRRALRTHLLARRTLTIACATEGVNQGEAFNFGGEVRQWRTEADSMAD